MTISIVIPVLNESAYINELLKSIINLDHIEKEILIVDGGSSDNTRKIVTNLSLVNTEIKLINNAKRFVSNGFNMAFRQAQYKYISLVGAHAIYPPNYFSHCIKAIASGECDAAGGFLIQKGKTPMGKAIAQVMSSRFGVGDTPFRTTQKRMYVDSVAFAVYDRKVFDKVGLLDEELVRNQDDEFHYRLNEAGFRILMLPELEVIYYVRDSLKALFIQYYQYGLYKPLVFKKVFSGMKWRHLVPAFFVLYLLSCPLALWWPFWMWPLIMYLVMDIYFSLNSPQSWNVKVRSLIVFPVLHIAYGSGFIMGLWKWRNHK